MIDDYGPFRKNQSYFVMNEGRDWVQCKNSGKGYYIPKSFIHPNPYNLLINESEE